MAHRDEIGEKERRVRDLIQAQGLAAILLKRQANFSWMMGGGLNLVRVTTELGATSREKSGQIFEIDKLMICF